MNELDCKNKQIILGNIGIKKTKKSLDSKVLIIGIVGSSSSGKSTVSDAIKEIIEKLNIPNDGRHWCNYIYNSLNDVKIWVEILKKDIEKCIQNEISKCSSKIIIIDSFMLPLLDVFEKCKYRILVKSNLKLKLIRVKIRLTENGRLPLFNNRALVNRVKYTEINNEKYDFDFTIKNNKTKNDLIEKVADIVKKVKE